MNICVRDIERWIAAYRDLEVQKLNDYTLDYSSVGDALGLKARKLRAAFMHLAYDRSSVISDLVY